MNAAMLQSPATSKLKARSTRIQNLTARELSDWQELEDHAVESNPFLSPLFVLPASRYLTPDADIHVILVEKRRGDATALVGVGLFERRRASRLLPLPHLKAYQPPGTTLTGLLVHRDHADSVLHAFFQFLNRQPASWQHMEFDLRSSDSELSRLLEQTAARFGKTWEGWNVERALIQPSDCNPDEFLSKSRRKKTRRSLRELQKLGSVSYSVVRDADAESEHARNFLQLENHGWKGAGKHSFLAREHRRRFFDEMTDNFARAQRVFFTELSLDEKVIGSTINLVSGNMAIAFKSGWHSDYAHLGVGNLQEIELARQAPDELSDLDYIDSGTGGRSWLRTLWPGRRSMSTGVFTGSKLATCVTKTMQQFCVPEKKQSQTSR